MAYAGELRNSRNLFDGLCFMICVYMCGWIVDGCLCVVIFDDWWMLWGQAITMVAEPTNAPWVRAECHALRHTSPDVRLRRGGAGQQPIQPNPTSTKHLSGSLGRCVARVGRHTCYRKGLASKLHTTGHWTDDTTRNELLQAIPIPSPQLRPTGYGHPSTAPSLPLRRAIATGSQAVRFAWARRGPRSHHTCPYPMHSITKANSTRVRSTG